MTRTSRSFILLLGLLCNLPFNFRKVTSSWLIFSSGQASGLYLSHLFRRQLHQGGGGVKNVGCFLKDNTMIYLELLLHKL